MRAIVLIALLLFTVPILANEDALFEQVFGKKVPETSYDITLKLVVERTHFTTIKGKINPYTQAIKINTLTVWEHIEPLVLETAKEPLFSASKSDLISTTDLEKLGYSTHYDAIYQTLHLDLPFDAKKAHTLSLDSNIFNTQPDFSNPISTWSGYTNIVANAEQNTTLYSFESIWSVKDWFSIEHISYLDSDMPNQLRFSEVRAVHESPENNTETFIGDIQTRQQLQTVSTPKMLGLSHRKSYEEFSLTPPQPNLQYSVTVSNNSKIVIRNNTSTEGIFNVKPGTYTITDIPVSTGKNVIEIHAISNDSTQHHTLIHYHDRNILKKGSSEYSYSIGVPHELTPKWRVTQHDIVGGVGLRTGLTSGVTSETSISKDTDSWTLSNSFLTAKKPGLIELKIETTQVDTQDNHYTLGVLIQGYTKQKSPTLKTRQDVQFVAQNNQSYTYKSDSIIDTSLHLDMAQILEYPTYALSFRPGITHYKNTHKNELSFTLSLSKPIKTLQSQFSVVFSKNPDNEETLKWIVRLSRSHSTSRTDFNSTFEDNVNQVRANWAYYPDPNKLSSQVSYSQLSENDASLSTQLRYKRLRGRYSKDISNTSDDPGLLSSEYDGTKFNVSLSQRYDGEDTYTAGSFQTAIAFADGNMGFAKEINNGFTLFTAPKSLNYDFIQFNTEDRITKFSSAVIADLIPYQTHSVSITKSQLPDNTFLQEHNFQIQPRKRQGSVVSIAPFGNVMLIGYLQHQNGTPLEYEFGDIKHDKDTSFGKQFFTNKSGKFVVTGLAPGEYTLSFYNANLAKIKINVPENSDSIVRLKEIKVPQNE
jgi:outer membrane usher protein FimD/PapC